MKPLTRRSVTTGLAAAVTAIPALGLCRGAEGPSELAALVRRYFEEVDYFNETALSTDWPQRRYDKLAKTHETTERTLLNTPVRTAEDALALLDYLWREERIEPWGGSMTGTVEAALESFRAYLAGRVA